MPRPKCPRRIHFSPKTKYFKPAGIPLHRLEDILMETDEFEALRLADEQDLYNQEAARKMGISRQTFDRIIRAARHKVATALVHGKALRIKPR